MASAFLVPAVIRAAGRGTRFDQPAEEVEDPLTGRKTFRLTDPDVSFHLPYATHRALARKSSFLLLGGEPSGSPQIYRYDVGRERVTQLTEGAEVDPYSGTLDARGRNFYYVQGDRVLEGSAKNGGARKVYQSPAGWRPAGGLTLTTDGRYLAAIEMREEDLARPSAELYAARPTSRVVVVALEGGASSSTVATAVEEEAWITRPQFRPGRTDILYAREGPWESVEGRLRLVSRDGSRRKNLRPREGEEQVGAEHWTADGSAVRFVYHAAPGYRGAEVRQLSPEDGSEAKIAKCSAFGWMRSNLDGTAIVGASRRPSGPNIYVLFTRIGREMTLAEHGSSLTPGAKVKDEACPAPLISSNSQWVYFTSARDGKPAVYRMKMDDLVSET